MQHTPLKSELELAASVSAGNIKGCHPMKVWASPVVKITEDLLGKETQNKNKAR